MYPSINIYDEQGTIRCNSSQTQQIQDACYLHTEKRFRTWTRLFGISFRAKSLPPPVDLPPTTNLRSHSVGWRRVLPLPPHHGFGWPHKLERGALRIRLDRSFRLGELFGQQWVIRVDVEFPSDPLQTPYNLEYLARRRHQPGSSLREWTHAGLWWTICTWSSLPPRMVWHEGTVTWLVSAVHPCLQTGSSHSINGPC